jgi:GntR family transcriptional regulator
MRHGTRTIIAAATETALAYKPLYMQVKEQLVRRLIDGVWQPGQIIASEIELAREIGVSQGTIRKALDVMTAERLLVRRQGRGTFVAEPEESRILFQFFRVVADSGAHSFPESRILRADKAVASKHEALALAIKPGERVHRLERIRMLGGKPVLVETITLPGKRFPGFEKQMPIPNNVYRLYSDVWNITIGRAEEKLKAIAATAADASALGITTGQPLLEIRRIARDLEDNPVELRVSRCWTQTLHYLSDLR